MSLVAIDCEMVGDVNNQAILAKVSIVDKNLRVLYNKFVKPTATVYDYRDTGIEDHQLRNGLLFSQVQNDVLQYLSGNVLVGHSVDADLRALKIQYKSVKDIADYYKDRNGQRRKLKDLAWEILGEHIQTGRYHDSVEDAVTAMKIYNKKPF